jgi:hypothetical protein
MVIVAKVDRHSCTNVDQWVFAGITTNVMHHVEKQPDAGEEYAYVAGRPGGH